MITHGNVLASVGPIEEGAQPYLRYERLIHPLRILHTLPLSHVFGQTMGLWVPPIFAAELHFENRLVARRLIETIHRERISVLAAVPRVHALLKTHLETTLSGLAERVARSAGHRAPWQRWWRFRDVHSAFGLKFWALISGGGALPGPLEQFWNALGFVLVQGYGMTETTALITLNHPFHVARGTIGKPLPGREVKLGPDGEVLVRGASISGATWSGGALPSRAETNGWPPATWPQAQPSGELRFLGRKSEVIVTAAGVNLHPEDLEAAIEQEPGVAACAVVATGDAGGPRTLRRAGHARRRENRPRRPSSAPTPGWRSFSACAAGCCGRSRTCPAPRPARCGARRWRSGWQASRPRPQGQRRARPTWPARGAFGASADWLLALIAQISGESPTGVGRRTAPHRRSAPGQPGPRAIGRRHRGTAGNGARERAAGRGANPGRTAAVAGGNGRVAHGLRGAPPLPRKAAKADGARTDWRASRRKRPG